MCEVLEVPDGCVASPMVKRKASKAVVKKRTGLRAMVRNSFREAEESAAASPAR